MKLTTMKSGNDKRLYVQKTIIKSNGKTASKSVACLGSVKNLMVSMNCTEQQVFDWAKKEVEKLTLQEKENKQEILIKFSQTAQLDKDITRNRKGGYLFLQCLYYALRFDNTFRNIKNKYKFDYDIDAIFSDLIFSRILDPGSNLSSFSFSQAFLEPHKYQLHDIYRCLSVLAKETTYIQSETFKNSNFVTERKAGILYYDCTNYYFEIDDEKDSLKYGKSKEHRPNPIIQMGLFMDTDGIPIAFCMFDGNSNEQKSLIPLEQRVIKDYNFDKFIVCTDAGLASKENKRFNSVPNRAFIITQSLKKLKKEDKEWVFKDENWKRLSDDVPVKLKDIQNLDNDTEYYYKEEPYNDKDIKNQRLIVTYSLEYARYQKTIRDKQIARAKKIIESGVYRKTKNENDPCRFIKEAKVTDNGEVADKSILYFDNDVETDEAQYDGLYACTTDLEDDVTDIMKVSKGRWEIEECFRIMKTDFEARPVFLQREDRINTHFLICFIALTLLRLLEKMTEKKYTITQLVDTLRSYDFLKLDEGYIPVYTRTNITDKLHEVFGFRTDYQIISKSNLRSIIKKTKHQNMP